MWTTILTVLLLTLTVDLGAAGRSPARKDHTAEVNATETGNRTNTSVGLLSEKDVTRLRIRNQTGFDGKVRNIRIDSKVEEEEEEERAGVQAYGAPKKHLREYGLIERVPLPEAGTEDPRNGRLIQAYGMAMQRLGTNGVIEKITTPAAGMRNDEGLHPRNRQRRSIDERSEKNGEEKGELDDLEAEDSKVFRPLFVYRRQQAKKQRLHRDNSPYPYNQHGKSCDHFATRH